MLTGLWEVPIASVDPSLEISNELVGKDWLSEESILTNEIHSELISL